MTTCDECGFDWDTPLLEKIRIIGFAAHEVAHHLFDLERTVTAGAVGRGGS